MEQEQLVLRIRLGIDEADHMARLYESMEPVIRAMAWSYRNPYYAEDLMQEGYLGLCKAVEHFDPDVGTPFSCYAAYWIRKKMLSYLAKEQRFRLLSSDPAAGEGEGSLPEAVWKPQEGAEGSVVDKIAADQLKRTLWGAVEALEEGERQVILGRYREGMTRLQLGRVLTLPAATVRRLEEKGLCSLRAPETKRRLEPYLDLYGIAVRGTGAAVFRRTWMSATERAAFRLMEE